MLSQRDPPLGVKKQVPSIRDMAVQVDQPQQSPIKVPLGQLFRTPSIKAMSMQVDLLQCLPVTPKTNSPQQMKDKNYKDYLQVPEEALDTSPYDQQLMA